jgi:hypothetical protein
MSSAIGIVRPTVTVPTALAERVDDDEREHRDEDDHDAEHRDERREPGHRADLLFRHLPERLAVAADARGEHDEVLDRAADHDADDDPERAREVAELRGQRRPDERPRPGDRREVVPEHDPPVGRHVVAPVRQPLGGGPAGRVEGEDARRDEPRVEAVGDEIRADGRGDEPRGADRLAAAEGEPGERAGADERDDGPEQGAERGAHGGKMRTV